MLKLTEGADTVMLQVKLLPEISTSPLVPSGIWIQVLVSLLLIHLPAGEPENMI